MEENNNHIENFFKSFAKSKKRICVFICGLISSICSFLFMAETSLNAIPLIYTLLILLAAVANIVYSLDVNGKNRYCGDIVVSGIALCLIGIVLRIIQLGIGFSVEYFIAYFLFGIVIIMLGLKIAKNIGKKSIITVFLVLIALYSIFEFFYSGNPYMKGFFWRLFHISEAMLFLSYVAIVVLDNGNISDQIGKYKSQIPSVKICAAILAFLALVSIGIGALRNLDNFNFSSRKNTGIPQNNNVSNMQNEKEKTTPTSVATPTSTPQPTPLPTSTPIPENTISIGQTVTNNMYEFTLNKVQFSYDVMPDNPPSYYSHYEAKPGQVYIYVNASVKNLQKQGLPCDEVYSVTADYNGGYTYSGFNIITDTDGNFTYASINSIDPLQTLGVHCLIDCPEEVETSTNPLFLTITMKDGSKYKYTIRG